MKLPSRKYKPARMLVVAIVCLMTASCPMEAQKTNSVSQSEPEGWSGPLVSGDIGDPVIPGSTKMTSDGLEVSGSGTDIWGVSDQFHFVYQRQTGDFDVAVHVTSLTAQHLYSRAGIMAREDLSPGSRHIIFLAFPDNRPRHLNTSAYEFQHREKADGESTAIYPPQVVPPSFPVDFPHVWLRLKRTGNEFTAFASTDGKGWKRYDSYTLDLPTTVFLGLAVTSHTTDTSTTAIFKEFEVIRGQHINVVH
jgi:regulation of enolase protein 1 (concanavalin A-like superfamily)